MIEYTDKQMEKVIVGIGYGAEQTHNARLVEPKQVVSELLRECPQCGRGELTARQRFCDKCKKENRRKTYRKAYYKKARHNG